MCDTWTRRDPRKEEQVYNALGETLDCFIQADGAEDAMLVRACGTFFAEVLGYVCATSCADAEERDTFLTTHLAALKTESAQRVLYYLDHPEP